MKRPIRVLSFLALLVGVAALGAGAGQAQLARNPFGLTVVRFAKGTTPDAMRTAVASAGGKVVVDLSRIGALAVVPSSKDFAARIGADARVRAAFQDERVYDVAGPDGPRALPHGRDRGQFTGDDFDDDDGPSSFVPPDPLHDAASFWGVTNPEGILQWDDNRMDVPAAWKRTTGSRSVRVAVLDSGVQASHKEIRPNLDGDASANMIPCRELIRELGRQALIDAGLWDCSNRDTDGHGTWVASRIAGAANGFGSNGVAPNVQLISYKVLATGFGGLPSWIVAAMLDACSRHVDLLNMSIVGYLSPDDPFDVEDYLLFADAVDYCRAQGTTVFAAAGNEHVRINRVNLTIGGRALTGVGQVDTGADGFANMAPGGSEALDLRGLLEVPAGVPGVVMVSATNNAIGDAPASVALRWKQHVGARDQLAYYSSYGSRVDLAAPGGARRFNIPSYDGGPDDILYGGWGSLGALSRRGEICTDPSLASPQTFACFTLGSAAFGWLQGTSMSSPNATGVAALLLSAHSELRGNPSGVLSRLQATARRNMTNFMGGNDGSNFAPAFDGSPCATAYCHVVQDRPVAFADAYGAGLVDAAAAVAR